VSRRIIYDRAAFACEAILAVFLGFASGFRVAAAQVPAHAPAYRYVVDGADWILPRSSASSLPDVQSVLESFRKEGYHRAKIDSLRRESGQTLVFISRGELARIRFLKVSGVTDADLSRLLRDMQMGPGSVLNADELERDADRILKYYAEEGYQMATVAILDLMPVSGDSLLYDVELGVNRGPPVAVARLELDGAKRSSMRFAARAAGLRPGEVLRQADLRSFQARLLDTGAFQSVGLPVLEIERDSTAVMIIPIEEAPPGSFDLVLGYLPATTFEKAHVVGSGHMTLDNPFGYGRSFGLKLDRRPGQVSSVDVRLRDPLLAGLPLRAEVSFSGLQQDSTYNRRRWSADLGYALLPGVEIDVRYSVEATRPGNAGLRIRGLRQRIPRSDVAFWGLGVRVRRLDRPQNPRSGVLVESLIENGDERGQFKSIDAEGDTTFVARSNHQERLRFSTRGYLPLFTSQVLVGGADVSVLLSDVLDESDLFRIGGAMTLRGYDEDQFRAATAVRFLVEYRVLLESVSNAFAFLDVGYVEKPEIADIPAEQGWHPGFGVGMQYQTALGVVSVSYAMNSRDGVTNGRVHIGLSFGL